MTKPERSVPQIHLFADRVTHYRDYYIVAETPTEAWAKTKEVDEDEYATDVTDVHTDFQRYVQPILLRWLPLLAPQSPREIWIIPTQYEADWRDESKNFYGYLINEEDQVVHGEEHAWERVLWEEVPPDVVRQQFAVSHYYFHRSCFDEIYDPEVTGRLLAGKHVPGCTGAQYSACFAFECPRGDLCMICYDVLRS